jgi:class 3 adenylate cyclase
VPFLATVGTSRDPDARRAGREAAGAALAANPGARLALAFGSIEYDQAALVAGLRDGLGDLPLVGASSFAEMSTGAFGMDSVVVTALSGQFGLASASARYGDAPAGAARGVAATALERLGGGGRFDAAILFCAAELGHATAVLEAVKEVLGPGALVFGGGAGSRNTGPGSFSPSHVYFDGDLVEAGLVLLLLRLDDPDLVVTTSVEHGIQPISVPRTCTRARDHYVYEVDGESIFAMYEKYIGQRIEDVGAFIFTYPVLCQVPGQAHTLVRIPYFIERDRGRIGFYPVVPMEGQQMSLAHSSRNEIVRACRESAFRTRVALGDRQPRLVLAVSCEARRMLLGTRASLEVETVEEVFERKVPLIGFYSSVEIAPADAAPSPAEGGGGGGADVAASGSHTVAQTFCLMVIGDAAPEAAGAEPDARPGAEVRPAGERSSPGASEQIATLKRRVEESDALLDFREQVLIRTIQDNIAMTRELREVNLGLSELNQKNQRLLSVIRQYTPQQTWRKAGKQVEQGRLEIPDESTDSTYMFLDVKGFTSFSENHSPEEVITALNAIFVPCADAIYARGGDIHKFIGDAIFAIFDQPLDGIRAALDVARAVAGIDTVFKLRIGLHCGRAIHGNVGSDTRRDNTLIGDAVNLTQRLEANCTPGRILISRRLREMVAPPLVLAGEARTIQAKGKSEPIDVFEVIPEQTVAA